MSHQNTPRQSVTPPEFWQDEAEHRRKIAVATAAALSGQTNNQFTVTLGAGETQSEVLYTKCRPDISVNLTPASATAAAAVGVWVEPQKGKAIIHHDSSPATDRRFFAVFVG